jgi:glycosyltransferase involved in cell wall biosynthesis
MNSCSTPLQPAVSIIIPSYNCERHIRQTLRSVVDQTFQDWEVIVVDDGSEDKTIEIADSVDPRIRVVQQENAGVCSARNRGYAESCGRFLCFLDHDDYWYPEKLSRQLGWMERKPELGVVYTNFLCWYAVDGEFPPPESLRPASDEDVLDADFTGWVYHQFMRDSYALTSSALIRREALEHCGLFDVSLPYSEDWDLFLRLSRKVQFAQMAWPSTLYRQHPSQGSRLARRRDYRTELLLRAAGTWGLASPDGRRIDPGQFRRQIARYRMEFGQHHLAYGERGIGVRALFDAWRRDPMKLRYLGLALAGMGGWRPAP